MSRIDFDRFIPDNLSMKLVLGDVSSTSVKLMTKLVTKLTVIAMQQPALALCLTIILLSLLGFVSKRFVNLMVLSFGSPAHGLQIWRWLSYGFVHQDMAHLGGNIAGIYLTLMSMQQTLPWTTLLLVFCAGVVFPAVALALLPLLRSDNTHYLGASCGLFALFGALAAYSSKSKLMLFYALPLPLYEALLIITAVSVGLHVLGLFKGVWHLGHALGIITGYCLIKYQALAWAGLQ